MESILTTHSVRLMLVRIELSLYTVGRITFVRSTSPFHNALYNFHKYNSNGIVKNVNFKIKVKNKVIHHFIYL